MVSIFANIFGYIWKNSDIFCKSIHNPEFLPMAKFALLGILSNAKA